MKEREYTSIRLEITSKCNINCVYCHNSEYANKNTDMSTTEIITLIKNLKKRYSINKVLLTGGEPLINEDIIYIVKTLTDLGIKSDLVTNGKLLSEEKILQLQEAGLKRIRLSIDGLEEHKFFRKGSEPDKLWSLAKSIADNTVMDLCIHTVCSSHNVKTLFNVYKKVLEVKANRWRIFDIGYKGATLKNKEMINLNSYYEDFFQVSKEIITEYISENRINELDLEINHIFRTDILKLKYNEFKDICIKEKLKEIQNLSPCNYIAHQATIRSNGISTFCQFQHKPIFEYKKYKFNIDEAIKNKNDTIENEIAINQIHHCKNCKHILVCNTGCRARAEFLTGNIKNPDPICCFIQPLIYKDIVPILPEETQKIFHKLYNTNGDSPLYCKNDLELFLKDHEFIF